MEKVIHENYDPAVAHEFVCSTRRNFTLKVNRCVKSGATMIVTDLPLSEAAIKALAKEV